MSDLLYEKLAKEESLFKSFIEIPNYIDENLKYPLRTYQKLGLLYFIQTQEESLVNVNYNHLLFKMATGSGKTNVMAAAILYLYREKGYNKFLFYVNSDAIINKTYVNFFNRDSNKFLFKSDELFLEGERVTFSYVNEFPKFPSDNTIYLKFTTVQKLHMDLKFPSENSITFNDLAQGNIVMLSDEAHHLNASTKKTQKDSLINEGWENTVLKILKLKSENRLLEFTATLDLSNPELHKKYKDKIIYNYDLRSFMIDKFSKNVSLIRNNYEDQEKLLSAVLLSQYRKYIALKNNIYLKPVILFKSNSVKVSLQAHLNFLALIENITPNALEEFINSKISLALDGSAFAQMYSYYQSVDISRVVNDIKFDFREENLLNANDKDFVSPKNVKLLNSLESTENNIRGIFAVAKLNEGWDVLNLYDIVRISEGAPSNKKTTDSEAQLIGRGARYYPFIYEGERAFKRRFDNTENELKILEQLHYHTINENNYVKQLNKSLDEAEIVVQEDTIVTFNAKVKDSFKRSSVYKDGFLYVNKTTTPSSRKPKSFSELSVQTYYEFELVDFVEQDVYSKIEKHNSLVLEEERVDVSKQLWRKALLQDRFYDFNNLKSLFVDLKGIEDFITSNDYLGSIILVLKYPKGQKREYVSSEKIIKYLIKVLSKLTKQINLNINKGIGTTEFEGIPIKDIVKDYSVSLNPVANGNFNQKTNSYPMKKKDWYVYDSAIVNGLEMDLIKYIETLVDELRAKYTDVYLIRNEQKLRFVEFDGVRGFMPDFVLYLEEYGQVFQLIIEPKGEFLFYTDQWKEEMLLKLNSFQPLLNLAESKEVNLYGFEFFSQEPTRRERFKTKFREITNIDKE